MKIYLIYVGAALVIFTIGAGVGRYATPPKIQERIVEKEVVHQVDHTITITKKEPNGTIITTTKDDVVTDETDNKTTQITISNRPNWSAFVGTGISVNDLTQSYIIGVDHRLIGELSIGLYGTFGAQTVGGGYLKYSF